MPRRLISSGSTFEQDIAYSRAVVHGDWVFVSGTTGFDYSTMTIAADVEAQTEQCLANIAAALAQAGASLADVVRVHYILPDAGEFPRCWPILRRHFGEVRPAATMIAGSRYRPAVAVAPIRTRPTAPLVTSRSRASARAAVSRIARASSSSASPATVSVTRRPSRLNNRVPIDSSSCEI